MKNALVFGANGQAGSYMCQFLLDKGYTVVGTVRESLNTSTTHKNVGKVCDYATSDVGRRFFIQGSVDVTMYGEVFTILTRPFGYAVENFDEVYNFTGKMFAPDSWREPNKYIEVNGLSVVPMLQALVHTETKFFNAGSAEMFDKSTIYQDEQTKRAPENPYGWAKYLAEGLVASYRKKYGMFACTGIFFNMESPRRPQSFFAQKVAWGVARAKRQTLNHQVVDQLKFGKLSAVRDWGWTPNYVEAAWRILQAAEPKDYVIGTGSCFTCKNMLEEALSAAGFSKDVDSTPWITYEGGSSGDYDSMCANPKAISNDLCWEASYTMPDVVKMLVEQELKNEGVLVDQSHFDR